MSGLIGQFVTTDTSECACEKKGKGGACSPPELLRMIEEILGAGAPPPKTDRKVTAEPNAEDLLPTDGSAGARTVAKAAVALECKSESCVLGKLSGLIVSRGAEAEKLLKRALARNFKPHGPRETSELTSNFDLDGTLERWAVEFPDFFPFPFAMMDFAAGGAPLARWSLAGILAGERTGGRPMQAVACILNTDVSTGAGKHWVCVFVDARDGRGKSADSPVTVEYFNSAGNPPPRAMTRWMESAREKLIGAGDIKGRGAVAHVETKVVTSVAHQRGDTECGLYALFYIRSRLEGRAPSAFEADRIPDAEMEKFRGHVFRRHKVAT
jgi:hypothetical protein